MPTKNSLLHVPDSTSLEKTEDLIRQRAYAYYEARSREDGHDLEDWLRAEAEILGKKQPESETRGRVVRAGAA